VHIGGNEQQCWVAQANACKAAVAFEADESVLFRSRLLTPHPVAHDACRESVSGPHQVFWYKLVPEIVQPLSVGYVKDLTSGQRQVCPYDLGLMRVTLWQARWRWRPHCEGAHLCAREDVRARVSRRSKQRGWEVNADERISTALDTASSREQCTRSSSALTFFPCLLPLPGVASTKPSSRSSLAPSTS
jgi:hypothetical protein